MSLHISPHYELRLAEAARREGLSVDELLERLMDQRNPAAAPESRKDSLVEFFRRSPLVGVSLNLERSPDTGRKIDLWRAPARHEPPQILVDHAPESGA
jgi:hypothetical protein